MSYDPRTLSFISEILHPPVQHDPKKLHALHSSLFADSETSYDNFTLIQGGATLASPVQQPNQVSNVSFLPDRIQIREELTAITLEEFERRVAHLAEAAVTTIGVQVFHAQQVIVRSVIQPRHFPDARQFLGTAMFSIPAERFSIIGRPAQLLGLRAIYPQTPEENNVYSLRIESFNNDPRSVFVEVVATFPPLVAQPPTPGATTPQGPSVQQLGENVGTTYTFLTERALPFIEQFDQPGE